ncbi:hypothetical protein BOTBODRAFT_606447 [Botryobasidium botryosum FD-172 SS1]|uniref:Uncharacterized protein n=1 Tax=Botryobasidium botryosum (strain FD-172 SS1) TaxID=930990 RepID=A0A067MNU7_BOTB1|nr:hypothetical protein BOTBODRAFT_606447 [Botryobasidium botryosum FD-172 SS1]
MGATYNLVELSPLNASCALKVLRLSNLTRRARSQMMLCGFDLQAAANCGRAPIHRLSSDPLLEIFFTIYGPPESDDSMESGMTVFHLSQVCRSWRQLIHSRPHFWSRIDIDLRRRYLVPQVVYWLERAGMCPLTISIRCTDSLISRRICAAWHPVGEVLHGSMNRWARLRCELRLGYQIGAFFANFPTTLEALEYLEVSLVSEYDSPRTSPSSTASFSPARSRLPIFTIPFERPPTNARGVCVTFRDCMPAFAPSFQQAVSSFTLALSTNYRTQRIPLLLQSCPSLVDLFLDTPPKAPRLPLPISLSHVVHLRASLPTGLGMISALSFPSLENLSLYDINWDRSSAVVGFLMSVFQTCPSLSRVSISGSPYTPTHSEVPGDSMHIDQAPVVLPNVVEFRISSAPIVYPLLHRLGLPRVQVLELENLPFDITYKLTSTPAHLASLSLCQIGDPCQGFQCRTFPALASLRLDNAPNFLDTICAPELRCFTYKPSPMPLPLRPFVERSAPTLRSLDLEGVEAPDSDMIWCLERLPSLRSLRLARCSVSDAALRALAAARYSVAQESYVWLLPQLAFIELEDNAGITPPTVIRLLKSWNRRPALSAAGGIPSLVRGRLKFSTPEKFSEYKEIQSYGDFLTYPPNTYRDSPVPDYVSLNVSDSDLE